MPASPRDAAYLWDIVAAGRDIEGFLRGKKYSDFQSTKLLRLGIEREIEIIGEAARRVSAEFQAEHPEIPWAQIVGQRNVIAHEYGDLKVERLWSVATEYVPKLVTLLEPLIPPPPEEVR